MKIILSDMKRSSDMKSLKFEAPHNISEERCVELLGETYYPRFCAQPGERWWDWAEEDENEEF